MKFSFPILLILIVIIGGALFFFFKPQGENTQLTPQPTLSQRDAGEEEKRKEENESKNTFELVVKNKELVSGPQILTVVQGEDVTIQIISDEEEELHLHGYDESIELVPNRQATLTFTADVSGRFPYELEYMQKEIGVLEVQPQ